MSNQSFLASMLSQSIANRGFKSEFGYYKVGGVEQVHPVATPPDGGTFLTFAFTKDDLVKLRGQTPPASAPTQSMQLTETVEKPQPVQQVVTPPPAQPTPQPTIQVATPPPPQAPVEQTPVVKPQVQPVQIKIIQDTTRYPNSQNPDDFFDLKVSAQKTIEWGNGATKYPYSYYSDITAGEYFIFPTGAAPAGMLMVSYAFKKNQVEPITPDNPNKNQVAIEFNKPLEAYMNEKTKLRNGYNIKDDDFMDTDLCFVVQKWLRRDSDYAWASFGGRNMVLERSKVPIDNLVCLAYFKTDVPQDVIEMALEPKTVQVPQLQPAEATVNQDDFLPFRVCYRLWTIYPTETQFAYYIDEGETVEYVDVKERPIIVKGTETIKRTQLSPAYKKSSFPFLVIDQLGKTICKQMSKEYVSGIVDTLIKENEKSLPPPVRKNPLEKGTEHHVIAAPIQQPTPAAELPLEQPTTVTPPPPPPTPQLVVEIEEPEKILPEPVEAPVIEATITVPQQVISEPTPTVVTPQPTVTTPTPTVVEPTPTVVTPQPTVTEPTPTISTPEPVSFEINEVVKPRGGDKIPAYVNTISVDEYANSVIGENVISILERFPESSVQLIFQESLQTLADDFVAVEHYARILEKGRCLIMCTTNFARLVEAATKAGLTYVQTIYIITTNPRMTDEVKFSQAVKPYVLMCKGKVPAVLNNKTTNAFKGMRIEYDSDSPLFELMSIHPYCAIISSLTNEYELILNPYADKGSVSKAAETIRRNFIAIEPDDNNSMFIRERIEKEFGYDIIGQASLF